MFRPFIVLAAVAVIAAPAAASAQTWPGGAMVVASASTIGTRERAFARVESPDRWRAPADLPPTQRVDHPAPLKLQPRIAETDTGPTVDIRPKAEWSDDQGLRFNWTKVAYKQRF